MRLFVYLLALITGFSAAHASPEKMRAASALDSAQAATALVEQDVPVAAQALAFVAHSFVRPDANVQFAPLASLRTPEAPRIYRGDRARE